MKHHILDDTTEFIPCNIELRKTSWICARSFVVVVAAQVLFIIIVVVFVVIFRQHLYKSSSSQLVQQT